MNKCFIWHKRKLFFSYLEHTDAYNKVRLYKQNHFRCKYLYEFSRKPMDDFYLILSVRIASINCGYLLKGMFSWLNSSTVQRIFFLKFVFKYATTSSQKRIIWILGETSNNLYTGKWGGGGNENIFWLNQMTTENNFLPNISP